MTTKTKSKLTRKQLALRLFGAAVIINGIVLLLLAPSSSEAEVTPVPANHVQVKVKAALFTPFQARESVLLVQDSDVAVGPVILLEQQEETLTIAVPQALYQKHHRRLAQEHWAAMPYLEGMLRPQNAGVRYEIAY